MGDLLLVLPALNLSILDAVLCSCCTPLIIFGGQVEGPLNWVGLGWTGLGFGLGVLGTRLDNFFGSIERQGQ